MFLKDRTHIEGLSSQEPTASSVFEMKFESPIEMRMRLVSALRHSARIPGRFSSSRIKTTYFDDLEGTSFFEARDGQLVKKKYRFRQYLDAGGDGGVGGGGGKVAFYSIEVKKRNDAQTDKVKRLVYMRLPDGFAITTFRGLISVIEAIEGERLNGLRSELPQEELYPVASVFYERLRFEDPREDVRYNLDTCISVHPFRDAHAGGPIRLGHDMFEVKGPRPGPLPSFLEGLGLKPLSFSKFVWGRSIFG